MTDNTRYEADEVDTKELAQIISKFNDLYEAHQQKKSWWQRIKEKLFGPKDLPVNPSDLKDLQEINIQTEVASVLLSSLAGSVWVVREQEESMPGFAEFVVSGIQTKDYPDGTYTIYIGAKDRWEHAPEAFYPLTEFLHVFMPVDDISFTDYHS
jgi:hypothetical protein